MRPAAWTRVYEELGRDVTELLGIQTRILDETDYSTVTVETAPLTPTHRTNTNPYGLLARYGDQATRTIPAIP